MTDDRQCSYIGCRRVVQYSIKYEGGVVADFCSKHAEKMQREWEDDIEEVLTP